MIIWVACEWFLVCCWLLYCSGTFGWDLGRRWRIFDLLFVTFFVWLFQGWNDRTSSAVFLIDCWWFFVHSFAFLIGCGGSYFCRDVWWVDRFLLWFFPICAPSNSNYNSCFKLSKCDQIVYLNSRVKIIRLLVLRILVSLRVFIGGTSCGGLILVCGFCTMNINGLCLLGGSKICIRSIPKDLRLILKLHPIDPSRSFCNILKGTYYRKATE